MIAATAMTKAIVQVPCVEVDVLERLHEPTVAGAKVDVRQELGERAVDLGRAVEPSLQGPSTLQGPSSSQGPSGKAEDGRREREE